MAGKGSAPRKSSRSSQRKPEQVKDKNRFSFLDGRDGNAGNDDDDDDDELPPVLKDLAKRCVESSIRLGKKTVAWAHFEENLIEGSELEEYYHEKKQINYFHKKRLDHLIPKHFQDEFQEYRSQLEQQEEQFEQKGQKKRKHSKSATNNKASKTSSDSTIDSSPNRSNKSPSAVRKNSTPTRTNRSSRNTVAPKTPSSSSSVMGGKRQPPPPPPPSSYDIATMSYEIFHDMFGHEIPIRSSTTMSSSPFFASLLQDPALVELAFLLEKCRIMMNGRVNWDYIESHNKGDALAKLWSDHDVDVDHQDPLELLIPSTQRDEFEELQSTIRWLLSRKKSKRRQQTKKTIISQNDGDDDDDDKEDVDETKIEAKITELRESYHQHSNVYNHKKMKVAPPNSQRRKKRGKEMSMEDIQFEQFAVLCEERLPLRELESVSAKVPERFQELAFLCEKSFFLHGQVIWKYIEGHGMTSELFQHWRGKSKVKDFQNNTLKTLVPPQLFDSFHDLRIFVRPIFKGAASTSADRIGNDARVHGEADEYQSSSEIASGRDPSASGAAGNDRFGTAGEKSDREYDTAHRSANALRTSSTENKSNDHGRNSERFSEKDGIEYGVADGNETNDVEDEAPGHDQSSHEERQTDDGKVAGHHQNESASRGQQEVSTTHEENDDKQWSQYDYKQYHSVGDDVYVYISRVWMRAKVNSYKVVDFINGYDVRTYSVTITKNSRFVRSVAEENVMRRDDHEWSETHDEKDAKGIDSWTSADNEDRYFVERAWYTTDLTGDRPFSSIVKAMEARDEEYQRAKPHCSIFELNFSRGNSRENLFTNGKAEKGETADLPPFPEQIRFRQLSENMAKRRRLGERSPQDPGVARKEDVREFLASRETNKEGYLKRSLEGWSAFYSKSAGPKDEFLKSQLKHLGAYTLSEYSALEDLLLCLSDSADSNLVEFIAEECNHARQRLWGFCSVVRQCLIVEVDGMSGYHNFERNHRKRWDDFIETEALLLQKFLKDGGV